MDAPAPMVDLEHLPMAAATVAEHGVLIAWNSEFGRRFGQTETGGAFLEALDANNADLGHWTWLCSQPTGRHAVTRSDGQSFSAWFSPQASSTWLVMIEPGVAPPRDQLNRALGRLRTVVNDLSDAIMVENEHRQIVISNASFSAMFGLPPPPDIVGLDCSSAAEQSREAFVDPEFFVERIEELLEKRAEVVADELRLLDGRILLRDYIPTRVDGVYVGHLWRYVDVTEARRVSDALDFERRRADAVINASLDAVITVDERGRILNWNASAERIFGYTEAEVRGRDMASIIVPPIHREGHGAGMARLRSGGEERITNQRLELIACRRDGTVFPCELTVTRQLYTDRVLFTGFLRDISDFVAARDGIKAVSEGKSRLMAAVNHDMRSPLMNILHRSELVGERASEQELTSHVRSVETSVWRIVAMLDELVSAEVTTSGHAPLRIELVDLADLCALVTSQRVLIAKEKGLRLINSANGNDGFIRTDANRVVQILSNLVDNAIKYTEQGEVVVEVVPDEQGCCVVVRDTGVGFDARIAERIYDAGYQADVSKAGLGLGLSIVKEAVRRLRGRLDVRSTPGVGSEFVLWLPAEPPADPSST